jgi:hypothetical protein
VSDDLYYTILRWANGKGVAKHPGMTVTLKAPPDLGFGPVHMVAYRPEVGAAELQTRADRPRRAMLREEIQAADAMLRSLTTVPTLNRGHTP